MRSSNYEIKVPVGTGDAIPRQVEATPPESLNAFQWHSVKRGESLQTIARKLNVKQSDLAEANSLSLRARVATGQRLIIPRAPTTLLGARPENSGARSGARRIATGRIPEAGARLEPSTCRLEPQPLVHRVKRGDTLSSIARLYNTTIESLKSWNSRTIRGNRINIGDRLTILRQPRRRTASRVRPARLLR